MLNISPIGRNCSREERNAYEVFDLVSLPPLPASEGQKTFTPLFHFNLAIVG